ncbi:Crp/Fnr family transcriptional regulator [Mycobacterium sp. 1164966.3]|uniref:Crp/Fnr family transcriptional regulator n=1 Tax=Mycobacterium sp. 1164966.3 TaxID=1856861 RepID=UPI00156013FB|nr:Crp/Fnr family transcriptional regulator [Mycobacterium sp. 1164966.3]
MSNTANQDIDPKDLNGNRVDHPLTERRHDGRGSSDVYQALIASGLFSKLDPESLFAVAEQLEPVQFLPGEIMVAQSSRGGRVYIIISGKVKVAYRHPEGGEVVLTILGPREMFGAMTLFDPEAHEIDATALTTVVAVAIERAQFLLWIAERPEFSDQVLRLFARWVKASTNSLVDFAFADAQNRVANQLLLLRKRFGRREGEAVRVVHDLTLEDFSLLVGVAPETICDTLREFEHRGWIRLEYNSVVVVDAHALSAISHSNMLKAHCV